MLIALFLAPEDLPHEDRDKVDQTAEVMLATQAAYVFNVLHFPAARMPAVPSADNRSELKPGTIQWHLIH